MFPPTQLEMERRKAGLSQKDLSFKSEVSNALISLYEHGHYESLKGTHRKKISEALGVEEKIVFPN